MKKSLFLLSLAICFLTGYGQQTGTFTDKRDGKIYKTVKIGTQTWMAENLAFKTDSGCWAYNNDKSNVATYGYLYNLETAKNVCPSGWHLPTDAELKTLKTYLGDADVAGGKLKEASTAHWISPNTGATNESGFTGLPGGYRSPNGDFFYIERFGYWWSSTDCGTSNVFNLYMVYKDRNAFRNNLDKTNALSVRCVKDLNKPTKR